MTTRRPDAGARGLPICLGGALSAGPAAAPLREFPATALTSLIAPVLLQPYAEPRANTTTAGGDP
ncbi:hypothetical protein FM113_03240 [Leucobacter sp. 7(1)]|uniref:hypothetical protein n=1 Tax=Leucobacter sp. 7(1) TaxID=1255613 RepID=UPI00097E8043|nr:hypothetical protein [Leucobacter sp. 7(1)]SJN08556.1 hypothetical protein FM113_03240 [Leucobacter sp. 7(1)]